MDFAMQFFFVITYTKLFCTGISFPTLFILYFLCRNECVCKIFLNYVNSEFKSLNMLEEIWKLKEKLNSSNGVAIAVVYVILLIDNMLLTAVGKCNISSS